MAHCQFQLLPRAQQKAENNRVKRVEKLSRNRASRSKQEDVVVKVGTANVQTLLPWQEDRSYAKNSINPLYSKVEILETNFAERGLQVVGIQEGRARSSSLQIGTKYKRAMSAAYPDGSCGVQTWVLNDGKFDLVHWEGDNPRLMHAIVKLTNSSLLIVVVGHAPHSGADESEKCEFWCSLLDSATKLSTKFPHAEFTFCVDANARVGSVQSPFIGTCECDKENANGTLMRAFLETFRVYAVNTWWNAGPTWCSTHGTWHRIDFLFTASLENVSDVKVDHDLDLTFNVFEDHKLVSAALTVGAPPLGHAGDNLTAQAVHFRVNKYNLADSWRREQFQADMWKFSPKPNTSINQWLDDLNEHVRKSARQHFGRPGDAPRQAWLSPLTWSIIKLVAPCRRLMFQARKMFLSALGRSAFWLWRANTTRSFQPGGSYVSKLFAVDRVMEEFNNAEVCRSKCAAHFRQIKLLQNMAAPSLSADREVFLNSLAFKAQSAMTSNDSRTGYAISRALGAARVAHAGSVKRKDGTITQTAAETLQRWEEHYTEVYRGTVNTHCGSDDANAPVQSLWRVTMLRAMLAQPRLLPPTSSLAAIRAPAPMACLQNCCKLVPTPSHASMVTST